jgi:hypothetical protein
MVGFLPLCTTAAGILSHLAGEPTVGATPNTVPHGGRHSYRHGALRQMYISRNFWFIHLFFENQRRKNITAKNIIPSIFNAKGRTTTSRPAWLLYSLSYAYPSLKLVSYEVV